MNRFLFGILLVFLPNILVSARIHKQHEDNIGKVKKYFANKARMHRPGATWEAGENDLTEKDPEELKSLCGTVALTRKQARSSYHPPPPSAVYNSKKRIAIDPEFDASVKWPHCTSIKEARDQGACGSCWAIAGAEAMTDRYCIASGGTKTKIVSTQDIVVCSGRNTDYCAGNYARAAYIMLVSSGVVSETCMPYTLGTSSATSISQCTHTCTNTTSGLMYPADKAYGTTWYEMGAYYTSNTGGAPAGLGETAVRQMQYELMTRGPMTIQIKVYEDFFSYNSGVYQHIAGGYAGNHGMKLIGWGTENGTDYWLIMNSWGTSWGTNGMIKIVRGINHLGIENYVVAGMVDPSLTAPPRDLTCNLVGCQGRRMYATSPADTCSMSYCACDYYVWNTTDWTLSPKIVTCDDGKAFDASGSVWSCVDRTLVPACNGTATTTMTPVTTTTSTTTRTSTTTTTSTTTPTTTTSTTTPKTTTSTTTPTTTTSTTTPTTTTSTTTPTTTTSTTTPTTTTSTTTPTTTTSTTTPTTTTSTTAPTTTTTRTTTTATTTPTTTTTTTAKPSTTQTTTTPTTTKPAPTSTTTKRTTTTTVASTTARRRVPLTTARPTTTSTTLRRRVPLTTSTPTTH